MLLGMVSSSDNSINASASDQDPVFRLPLMEAELATRMMSEGEEGDQLSENDKVKVEELRTSIADAKTAAEFGVRKSQQQFYGAFSTGDANAMSEVWSDISHVRCVHPGMESIEGRDAVMESWRQILSSTAAPLEDDDDEDEPLFSIDPERVRIDICGSTAICSCVERTQNGGQLEAINIYKRENGSWKMTLHQAGPVVMMASTMGT